MTATHYLAEPRGGVTVLPALAEPSSNDETNHRIANSLQLLGAMVAMEARRTVDPIAAAALDMTMRRIAAIASVQRMLYQSSAANRVDLGAYLADLCDGLGRSCAAAEAVPHVHLSADPIEAPAEDASAIGVIVSELVGNACKYAYPAGVRGEIRVTLRAMRFGGYLLEVVDRGVGMAADAAPQGTGLGGRVIAMMAQRLGARPLWRDARPGTRFELHVGTR